MSIGECPWCNEVITLGKKARLGHIITCPGCESDLEVTDIGEDVLLEKAEKDVDYGDFEFT